MSSSVPRKRVRKSPEARRAEIVEAATAVALAEGLECVTLRRIADELTVRPGLISHYFPSAEELVAEAFGTAATAELDRLVPEVTAAAAPGDAPGEAPAAPAGAGAAAAGAGAGAPPGAPAGAAPGAPAETPVRRLARFLAQTTGEAYDDISRLWINARHLSRYRPVLRDRVTTQQAAWRGRLEALVREGVERGEFRTADPYVATIAILVVLDGLGSHVNTPTGDRPGAVLRMAVTTAERELGLPPGTLDAPAAPAPPSGAP
ncbi:TetR/AcrR family transcriptional regulator [Streptomyces sp. NPDC101132]|uniref:TetR/AcrR family transcriptional regulator n=1 Tax=Streptomyces sp. NPDC101132 TaxID=3366110 RepID=UPI00381BBF19